MQKMKRQRRRQHRHRARPHRRHRSARPHVVRRHGDVPRQAGQRHATSSTTRTSTAASSKCSDRRAARARSSEGALALHYQPQLDLRTGEILAVEALLRWPHPRLGLVPPLKFIPLAEDAGLMQPLTALVLDEALAQCAEWRSTAASSPSRSTSRRPTCWKTGSPTSSSSCSSRHDLPGEALVIEITETSIITDFERSKAVIEALRDLGVVVSIDDFGAGFTSLAYLSNLAVRELKLDRELITGSAPTARNATSSSSARRSTSATPWAPRRRRGDRGRRHARPAERPRLRPRAGVPHQSTDAREQTVVPPSESLPAPAGVTP